MSYPRSFLKLSFGGPLIEDQWVTGLNFTSDAITTGLAFTANQEAFHSTDMETLSTIAEGLLKGTANRSMVPYSKYEWIKLAFIGEDGKYITEAKTHYLETVVSGVSSLVSQPQSSVVASFQGASHRSPAGRGRMYLPPGFIAPQGATGRNVQAQCISLAEQVGSFIEDVREELNSSLIADFIQPTIMSSSPGGGAYQKIVKIGVGDITDVQRRRRNRTKENYYAVSFD